MDADAIVEFNQDTPVDLRVVSLKAKREVDKDIKIFWSGEAQLQDFEEYPKLYRFLRDSLMPLRRRVIETKLEDHEPSLISMDTLEIIFTL